MHRPPRSLLIPFSFGFWSGAFIVMTIASLGTIALRLLGVPYPRVHGWVTAPLFSSVVRLSGTRLRIHYADGFDPHRPSVFCQNHVNLMDGHLAAAVIPHAFSGLMNAWQMKIPVYGWLMRLSMGIPVRRARADKVLAEMSEHARARRDLGMSILVFPEGHRTLDGQVGRFHRGVFVMARNAEMPVVPVAVRGMFDVNRKGSKLFVPGRTVDVHVGRQIETAGLDDKALGRLAQELQAEIARFVEGDAAPDVDLALRPTAA